MTTNEEICCGGLRRILSLSIVQGKRGEQGKGEARSFYNKHDCGEDQYLPGCYGMAVCEVRM